MQLQVTCSCRAGALAAEWEQVPSAISQVDIPSLLQFLRV